MDDAVRKFRLAQNHFLCVASYSFVVNNGRKDAGRPLLNSASDGMMTAIIVFEVFLFSSMGMMFSTLLTNMYAPMTSLVYYASRIGFETLTAAKLFIDAFSSCAFDSFSDYTDTMLHLVFSTDGECKETNCSYHGELAGT